MTSNSSVQLLRRTLALVAIAALLAGCGRGEEEQGAATARKSVDEPAATAAKPPASADGPDSLKANAVATGKTSAAVDLKYDVLSKPDPGQEFEIELVFLPRAPAESLKVEITSIPGITLVRGGTARFENVTAGGRYPVAVVARADGPGLYYLGVAARMVSKVQTEARTFSVPVVVGAVAAAEKPTPVVDASGEAVESMPAAENGNEAQGGSR